MTSLSIEQVAERLNCSRRNVYYMIKTGKLQSIKVKMSRRVTVESVKQLEIRGYKSRGKRKKELKKWK